MARVESLEARRQREWQRTLTARLFRVVGVACACAALVVGCGSDDASDGGSGASGAGAGTSGVSGGTGAAAPIGGGSGSGGAASGDAGNAGTGGADATGGTSGAGTGAAGTIGTGGFGGGVAADTDIVMLPYYRLRVEFIDQGDWADLNVGDPSQVIKVRQMELVGDWNVLSIERDHLGLNTDFGSDLSVVVDYALVPEAIDAPFALSIAKGGAGTVTIRISTVVGDTVTLVHEIVQQPGALDFTVDLSSLQGVDPWYAPIVDVAPMGMALYYPWYSLDSWSSDVLRDTPATPYASDNPDDVQRQIDQAQSASINSFVVSWVGPGHQSDQNFSMMLDVAEDDGFKVGVFLEILQDDGPARAAEQLVEWLSYLVSTYQDHPALLTVNDRVFVVPYLSDTIPLETWATIRADLRAMNQDVWLVEDRQDMDFLEVFDGMWFDSTFTNLGPLVRYHSVLSDNPAPKIWIPTVNPGVDDSLVPGRTPIQIIPREDGDRMRRMLAASLTSEPHWVMAHTWNEWWENTYIEPSVTFGDEYLRMMGDTLGPWVNP